MTSVKSKLQVAMVLAVTVIVYAAIVIVGLRGSLNGDFDQYLVPGKYAAPANIATHGFDNRVFYEKSAGWDGQFYYYHSDDPLLLKDTVEHIDMPAYRAQRVGIPAITYVLSRLTGQDWVSPKFYFTVTVGLQLIAAYMLATFLISRGYSAWYALVWAVGGSTLYTVGFGFIDGSADALIIISLILYANKNLKLYILAMSLAVLSKESYVLIPVILAFSQFISHTHRFIFTRHSFKLSQTIKSTLPNCIPPIILLSWILYLHLHLNTNHLFDKSSSGMLNLPFKDMIHYIMAGINGETLSYLGEIRKNFPSYRISIGVSIFSIMLITVFSISIHRVVTNSNNFILNPISLGVLLCTITLSAVYMCLGATQLWEPVGFVKASSLVIGMYLIYSAISKEKVTYIVLILSIVFSIYSAVVVTDRNGLPPFVRHVS
ncbi:hypothetical protein [Yersinia proxima]|uniref:hypothetical protein n=1 Tax=Yersinia proxima TaxID=2890316 RepID=UPI001D12BFA7|nr:hypothetical protein [Yersinia proxima]